jgi:hypothetical protein
MFNLPKQIWRIVSRLVSQKVFDYSIDSSEKLPRKSLWKIVFVRLC